VATALGGADVPAEPQATSAQAQPATTSARRISPISSPVGARRLTHDGPEGEHVEESSLASGRNDVENLAGPASLAVIKGIVETLVWIGIVIGVVVGFVLGRLTKR
jgi:hypothetical protein